MCRAVYVHRSIYLHLPIHFHTQSSAQHFHLHKAHFTRSMHFHSFETYRARVGGPVCVVGGGDEDGAALPRIDDLALVARGEGRRGGEGVAHIVHLGDVPST